MGLGDFLFGSKGGLQTAQVPRWNKEQQALFRQMYGVTTPEIGRGLEPTPEETRYGEFLRGYEPWYRDLTQEVTDPRGVEEAHAGMQDYIRGLYDPAQADELYNPEALREFYQESVYPEFEQTALPAIRSEFAGPGYWGEARARAVSDAYGNIARQEAGDLYGLERERQARRWELGQGERGALLSEELSRRADMLGLDMQGRQMLAGLAQTMPVAEQTLAAWSRLFTPENSPYMRLAMDLLGLQPFDTIAGMQQPTGGFLGELAGGVGAGFGFAGGSELARMMGMGK